MRLQRAGSRVYTLEKEIQTSQDQMRSYITDRLEEGWFTPRLCRLKKVEFKGSEGVIYITVNRWVDWHFIWRNYIFNFQQEQRLPAIWSKTSRRTEYGFRFLWSCLLKWMHSFLRTATEALQRSIDAGLFSDKWQGTLAYLNDVTVVSNTPV